MSHFPRRLQVSNHPEFNLLDFDLGGLLAEVRSDFPMLGRYRIEIWLRAQPTLACIAPDGKSACIWLHAVLNHPETPRSVIEFIICHELIHLLLPPRNVDGKRTTHPPEFWQVEGERIPNRAAAWRWILVVLGSCLRIDRQKECTFVSRKWKSLLNGSRPTLEMLSSVFDADKTSLEEALL